VSVYRPGKRHKTYIYDFEYNGDRYRDSTHQTNRQAALLVEAKKKLELREQRGGLVPAGAALETPTFSAWADTTLHYQAKFIRRPATLESTLRMVLAFWGAKPKRPTGPPAVARVEPGTRPYHNLRLGDPITEPSWLERFEQWMVERQVSGSTRNSYLSACSDLYTCALQPQYRATTGVTTNPFAGIRRSPTRARVVALTPAQILALVDEAERHIAHALCVAALAPKLRLASILALEWATHLDADLTTITIGDHKTSHTTGLDQVVPVSDQLRDILTHIRAAQARQAEADDEAPSRFVITWRGEPVAAVKKGLRRAVEAIGLTWGLRDGVTFHVMRHSIATILANPTLVGPLTERLRADVMGHEEIRTTQKYTHLNTAVQAGPHERLSATLPGLRAAVAQKDSPREKSVGESVGTPSHKTSKNLTKRVVTFARPKPAKADISANSLENSSILTPRPRNS